MTDAEREEIRAAAERLAADAPPLTPEAQALIRRVFGAARQEAS